MRLWSVHPRYLDRQGLLALWREALLAKAVLVGATRGYKHHPQLLRFKSYASPVEAIDSYLHQVFLEAGERGYSFAQEKIGEKCSLLGCISVTAGQLSFEREHLLNKLTARSPDVVKYLPTELSPHPLFNLVEGLVEEWEK